MTVWEEVAPWLPNRPRTDAESVARRDLMDLARRVDWRFLLPEPVLGRVAYAGPKNGLLADALRRFAEEMVPVEPGIEVPWSGSPGSAGDAGNCDLAVVASRRLRDLEEGIGRVRPGGYVYWEVDRLPHFLRHGGRPRSNGSRGPRVGGLLRNPRSILEDLGLEDIRIHCDFPGFRSPRVMFSPDPAAIRYVTKMRGKRLFGLERPLGFAARRGLLPRIVPWLAVVAKRPGGDEPDEGLSAAAFLGGQVSGWRLDRVPWVLLAPPLSWFLITIFVVPGSGRPLAVVKAIRIPRDEKARQAMDREAESLRFAEGAPLSDPSSVPLLMASGQHAGIRSLAQSAASGHVLTRSAIRRRPEYWTRHVVDWLTELHRATRHHTAGDDWRHARLLERPLRELRPHLPPRGPLATLTDRTLLAVRPLMEASLPFVLEHGDLWGSNILVGMHDRISVVDWEWAEPHGLPGRDLFFFLAFVAMARERAETPGTRLEAFRRAFRGPSGWARPWIAHYWQELELPPETAGPLMAACWSRLVRRMVRRPDGILAGAPPEARREALWQHHYFRFWTEIMGPSGSLEEPYANLTTTGDGR